MVRNDDLAHGNLRITLASTGVATSCLAFLPLTSLPLGLTSWSQRFHSKSYWRLDAFPSHLAQLTATP